MGVRRLGPDIRPSSADCVALIEARRRGEVPAAPPAPPRPGERPACGTAFGGADYHASGVEMSQFAITLGAMMQQTVVDRTGLTGRFDLDVLAILDGQPGAGVPPPGGPDRPSIFTAVQEQLGLKLDPQRGPVETFVIDSVELPTPD